MLLSKPFARSPLLARVLPFVIFVLLTYAQGKFGPASAYWFYFAKTLVGGWLVWELRAFVTEMRWTFSGEAVVVGIGVFALWVGLDPYYPKLMKGAGGWNPFTQFGDGSALGWLMVVTRIAGGTLAGQVSAQTQSRPHARRAIERQAVDALLRVVEAEKRRRRRSRRSQLGLGEGPRVVEAPLVLERRQGERSPLSVEQFDRAADSSGTATFVGAIAIRLPDIAERRGSMAPEVAA